MLTAQSSGGTCDVSVEGEKIEEVKVMYVVPRSIVQRGGVVRTGE